MIGRLTLGATAAAIGWTSPALAAIVPSVARVLRVPCRMRGRQGIAITFDDGPHPLGTPAVLRALDERGAKATFFLVGEQVERYPSLAAEIADAGHSIAVHGHRHRNMLRLSPGQLRDDLDRAVTTISEATGTMPTIYRPPYGIFSLSGPGVVRSRGLQPLLWSRWGHDWRAAATASTISTEVTRVLTGGDVLLLHDADHYSAPGSWRATAMAIPEVLAAIEDAGLEPAGLSARQRHRVRRGVRVP